MYGITPQFNIDRINNQIKELQALKDSYQNIPQQQPITNIINTNGTQSDFKAQILKENEKPEEILINTRTMFFEPKNGKLYIKELNGDIQSYDVILPKTKEQIENEELKNYIKKLEVKIDELTSTNKYDEPNKKDEKSSKFNDTRTTKVNE